MGASTPLGTPDTVLIGRHKYPSPEEFAYFEKGISSEARFLNELPPSQFDATAYDIVRIYAEALKSTGGTPASSRRSGSRSATSSTA